MEYIDYENTDPDVRKKYPQFASRDDLWLVAVEKTFPVEYGDHLEVVKRSTGEIKIVQVQDQAMFQPSNMKPKNVFLFKDVTELVEQGYILPSMMHSYVDLYGKKRVYGEVVHEAIIEK